MPVNWLNRVVVKFASEYLSIGFIDDRQFARTNLTRALFCLFIFRWEFTLELPHLPDMVFWKNQLILTHKNGGRIEFSPMEALKRVSNGKSSVKVACSDEWKETRPDTGSLEEVKSFDWTFTTDYQGTFNEKLCIEDTEEKLDIFKLMKKERILFYHDLTLFEDELHDHGIASCSAKIVSCKF